MPLLPPVIRPVAELPAVPPARSAMPSYELPFKLPSLTTVAAAFARTPKRPPLMVPSEVLLTKPLAARRIGDDAAPAQVECSVPQIGDAAGIDHGQAAGRCEHAIIDARDHAAR